MKTAPYVVILVILMAVTVSAQLAAPALVAPLEEASTMPTFEWDTVPRATWYWLWVSLAGDSTYAPVMNEWVEGNTFDATTSLTEGQEYAWWVAAWGPGATDGYGPWSGEGTFTVALPPRTNTCRISCNSFVPSYFGYEYTRNIGRSLITYTSWARWIAPFSLPDGAIIQDVVFRYYNDTEIAGGAETQLYLDWAALSEDDGGHILMLKAGAEEGYHSVTSSNLNYLVDNTNQIYHVFVTMLENNAIKSVDVNYLY